MHRIVDVATAQESTIDTQNVDENNACSCWSDPLVSFCAMRTDSVGPRPKFVMDSQPAAAVSMTYNANPPDPTAAAATGMSTSWTRVEATWEAMDDATAYL